MRPSEGSARRLIIRSSVDLPAPERPITPRKLPGATENDALSTAAFVPKRHVKPSTTNMQSSTASPCPSLSPGFYSCVTALPRCSDRPHPVFSSSICHDIVIKHLDDDVPRHH